MRKGLIVYLAPVLLVGAVAWVAFRPHAARPVAVGEAVPDFSLPRSSGPGGSLVRLGDYRGRVLVLNFWATWCPPCVAETPSLEDFAAKVQPWGVEVVGVSVDENPAALAAFVSKYNLTYTIVRDPSRASPLRYGTLQFPETYIIDRHGRLAEKIISNTDWTDPRMLSFVRALAEPNQQQASN